VRFFPLAPKLFILIMLNYAVIFAFLLPHILFGGGGKLVNITFKVPHISHHLAKFHGDRPRGLGDFAPKPIASKIVVVPTFRTYIVWVQAAIPTATVPTTAIPTKWVYRSTGSLG